MTSTFSLFIQYIFWNTIHIPLSTYPSHFRSHYTLHILCICIRFNLKEKMFLYNAEIVCFLTVYTVPHKHLVALLCDENFVIKSAEGNFCSTRYIRFSLQLSCYWINLWCSISMFSFVLDAEKDDMRYFCTIF